MAASAADPLVSIPPPPLSGPLLTRGSSIIEVCDCPVCLEPDLKINLMVVFQPCQHAICRPCTIGVVRTQLVPGAKGVFCPVCTTLLEERHRAAPDLTSLRISPAPTTPTARPEDSTSTALPPLPASREVSVARPVLGQLTEAYMRRLQAWSSRPRTVLPGGTRPLTVEDVKRFESAVISSAVEEAAKKKATKERMMRCPSAACGLLFVLEECTVATGNCPYCGTSLCLACSMAWGPAHAGRSCEDAATASREGIMDDLLVRRQGATFRQCPSCHEAITHYQNHGCHHMTCNCGAYFCTCLSVLFCCICCCTRMLLTVYVWITSSNMAPHPLLCRLFVPVRL
jgi:hypothetical protein